MRQLEDYTGALEEIPETASHPVGLTAGLYLREAIREERYEECPEMIAIAREFLQPHEIEALLS